MKQTQPTRITSCRGRVATVLVGLLAGSALLTQAQTPVPASLKADSGTWNASVQGFAVRPHQIAVARSPGDPNSIANVEKELNGGFGASLATPGPNAGYYFTNVLDFSDSPGSDVGQIFANDFPFPGINLDPASPAYNPSNFVIEAITYLSLPAGIVTLSVRSDDSFRLTIGAGDNPLSFNALSPAGAVYDGTRGPDNNTFTLNVASAGVYPVRIVYGQGDGGASLEFWATIDSFGTPTPMLINDPNYPTDALKSYVPASLPIAPAFAYARFLEPIPGQTGVSPQPVIRAELLDAGTTVNTNGITLSMDGSPVAIGVTKSGGLTTVTGAGTNLLTPNSVHTATLVFQDSTPKSITNTWSFTVINYFPLSASYSYPIGSGDVAAKGFSGKINAARKSSGGFSASISVTDLRLKNLVIDPLTGQPYSNLVQTASFPAPGSTNTVNSDGTYTRNAPINYSLDGIGTAVLDNGQFNSVSGQEDTFYPGLPGANEADRVAFENVGTLAWAEWTWLELPQGLITLNIGHFDAGQVSVHANDPRDLFRESVIFYDSNGGNRTDSTLVYVEAAGIYGFRCAQAAFGTGSSPWFEFYASDSAGNNATLIGDSTNLLSIKAFAALTVPSRPFIDAVRPGIGASGVSLNTTIAVDVINIGAETPVMKVNGQTVSYSTSVSGNKTTLTHTPAQPVSKAATVAVSLSYGQTTSAWSFFTTTGLKALVVGAEKASIGQRLALKHGLDVTQTIEGSVPLDTNYLAQFVLIWNSEAVNSGNAIPYLNVLKNNAVPVPLINVEQGNVDEVFPGLVGGGSGGENAASVIITHPESPLAGGLSGTNRILVVGATPGTWHRSTTVPTYATPLDSIGTSLDGGQSCVWGITGGTDNGAGYVYPARRVQFPIAGPGMIQVWNDNAWKLFDAAVNWVLPPKMTITRATAGNVTISWTGDGTLQESATVDAGSWVDSSNQANPQPRAATGTKFFRIRQ